MDPPPHPPQKNLDSVQLKEPGSRRRAKIKKRKNPIKVCEEQMRSQDKAVLRALKTAISP